MQVQVFIDQADELELAALSGQLEDAADRVATLQRLHKQLLNELNQYLTGQDENRIGN